MFEVDVTMWQRREEGKGREEGDQLGFGALMPWSHDLSCLVIEFTTKKVRRKLFEYFYPWSPKVEPWVNRWTFSSPSSPPPSSPSPPSHHQICQRPLTKTWFQRPLTIETENAIGGGGAWVFRCDVISSSSFSPPNFCFS